MTKFFNSLIIILTFFSSVQGQSESLSALEISHFDDFKTYRSYPSMCVDDVFKDRTGKLWLKSCGAAIQLSAHLFSFDGYKFALAPGEISNIGNHVRLSGVIKDTLYGSEHKNDSLYYFKTDLTNHEFQYYDSIPYVDNWSAIIDNDKSYQCYTQKSILRIKTWEGKSSSVKNFDLRDLFGIDSTVISRVNIHDDKIWIWDSKFYRFYTLDLKTNSKSTIDLSQNFKHIQSSEEARRTTFYFSGGMLHMNYKNLDQYYLKSFQLYSNQQVAILEKSELVAKSPPIVYADKNSNLLYIKEQGNGIQAFIELEGNLKLDASNLFENIKINHLRNIIGDDFLTEFYICSHVGFSIVKVKSKDAIQKIEIPESTRSLNEINDHLMLVNSQNRVSYIHDFSTGQFAISKNLSCIEDEQLLKKRGDEYWGFNRQGFNIYNFKTQECNTITTEFNSLRVFDFYQNNIIIGSSENHGIVVYDIDNNTHRIVKDNDLPFRFKSIVHNILVDSKDRIWMVNAEGLYRFDINTDKVVHVSAPIEGFNFKLLSIHEGDDGNIWLGSSLSGLVILNPDTKDFLHISSDQGLCNNTVASITRDKNGNFWLGTYNGVALLNESGGLITNFYEKDGLVNNESNRYSSTLLSNGKIVIGSVNGLSLINPDVIMTNLYDKNEVNIYLTNVTYFDENDAQSKSHYRGINNVNTIALPPQSRNLTLEFAVSNYIRPLENKYAYRIDAFHDDWVELGNNNSLELRDLPAGRYKLEIKGGDNLGNWSKDNLEIEINAKQFFYKSWWFYLLILGFISALVLSWVSTLRTRVKNATSEIVKDKEIIERQANKLKELDQAKSDLFTNISHEFRTPLTIISGMIDQIKSKPDAWLDKGSVMIKDNVVNLLNLVNQILDLRKLESENLAVNLVQGEVISYVRYLVDSHKHLGIPNDISLSFESNKEEFFMDYDPEKLLRILSNLLSNAIKYNTKGGRVIVSMTIPKANSTNQLIIKITDTGLGIPKEDLEGIFNRFYQSDSEKHTSITGTGIGLSLTKQLVELLGGQINVESKVGSGSTFTVSLPVHKDSQLKSVVESEIKSNNTILSSIHKSSISTDNQNIEIDTNLSTVLVVEDNDSIITLIRAQLDGDYNVISENNGNDGVESAIDLVPDIIISDVMMPGKDGIQLCQELKSNEKTSHIPIILLTAKAGNESKMIGLKAKADAYMPKPFDAQELQIRVSNFLEYRKTLHLRYKQLDKPTVDSISPKEDAFVLKFRNLILDKIEDDSFGIPQVCRAIGISRSQLHNKTKALTGLSTANYIRSIRLYKAKEMLENTEMNVSEVAYAVGFNNPTYFSSSYSQEFGESPSKTRKH